MNRKQQSGKIKSSAGKEGDIVKTQCKYCNRVIKGKQPTLKEPICYTCYDKRKAVRKLIRVLEPLRKQYEQRLIDGVEFNLDNGLPLPPEDLKRYYEIIERREQNE